MESALAWVGQIASWIGAFIPRWVILDTTEGGIRYVGGKRAVVCGPGIHFYWPARSTFVTYPTARQTDRIETQKMETTDGKSFIASGTLTYTVENLAALLPTTHNPTVAVIEIASTALHDVLCDMSWEEMQMAQRKGTLKTQLKNRAQYELTEYGIKVLRFKLNSLARSRMLSLSVTTASEEN